MEKTFNPPLLQASLSAALILVAALAPPAKGAMVAVPLGAAPARSLLGQEGVRLIGAGTIEGSLVIQADAIPIGFALTNHILLMRAIPEFCSSGTIDAQN